MNRRAMIQASGGAMAAALLGPVPFGPVVEAALAPAQAAPQDPPPTLKFAVILSMVRPANATIGEKFAILKRAGFDGVEIQGDPAPLADILRARDETGIRIHGVIDPVHWDQRLSDPDAGVRAKGLAALQAALRQSHSYGGTEVLLVPGRVTNPDTENHQQVWDRSTAEIRKVLGLAAELGVRICIENVSNDFCYDPKGGSNQTPDKFVAYLDQFKSPWIGLYYDVGNHAVFGNPGTWIRTLGPRIIKLHIKDRIRATNSTADVGLGEIDWAGVRAALRDSGFNGWCTAEVNGGDEARLVALRGQMEKALRG